MSRPALPAELLRPIQVDIDLMSVPVPGCVKWPTALR
jgi:hypothetical protein